MKDGLVALRLTQDFAYEGARAFLRPKLSEELQVPLRKARHLSVSELEMLSHSPNAFFYFGLGVEIVSATLVFLAMVALAFSLQVGLEAIVSAYGNPAKWEPVVSMIASGISLVGLVLQFIFAAKVWQAVIHRVSRDA